VLEKLLLFQQRPEDCVGKEALSPDTRFRYCRRHRRTARVTGKAGDGWEQEINYMPAWCRGISAGC
jgi:hypothetical protein